MSLQNLSKIGQLEEHETNTEQSVACSNPPSRAMHDLDEALNQVGVLRAAIAEDGASVAAARSIPGQRNRS